MTKRIFKIFHIGRRFRKEFKKQIRLFIVMTLAFTIAFSWRQTTFDLSQSFIQFITNIKDSATSSILTSLFITFLSILAIYLTSYILKDTDDY
jgi:hypothetical protein